MFYGKDRKAVEKIQVERLVKEIIGPASETELTEIENTLDKARRKANSLGFSLRPKILTSRIKKMGLSPTKCHFLYVLNGKLVAKVISSFYFYEGILWHHISASASKCLSVAQMLEVKSLFCSEDKIAYMIFPKQENYINVHANTLHLWVPLEEAGLPNFKNAKDCYNASLLLVKNPNLQLTDNKGYSQMYLLTTSKGRAIHQGCSRLPISHSFQYVSKEVGIYKVWREVKFPYCGYKTLSKIKDCFFGENGWAVAVFDSGPNQFISLWGNDSENVFPDFRVLGSI